MKDLYAKLGISPDASTGEIVAAGQVSSEAGACAQVLADATQRAAYDRAYSTLKSIGILRHRLGLDSGESWFLNRYPDFAPRFRSALVSGKTRDETATLKTSAPAAAQAEDKPQPAANSNRLVPILVAAGAIVLVVVLILVFQALR